MGSANTINKRFTDKWEFVQYYSTPMKKLANRIYELYGDKMYLDVDDVYNTLLTVCAERFDSLDKNSGTTPTRDNIKSTISRLKPYIEIALFRDTTHTMSIPLTDSAELKGRTKIEREAEGVKYKYIAANDYDDSELVSYTEDISDEAIFNTIRGVLVSCMSKLTALERRVLDLRFGLESGKELTLEDCARIINMERENADDERRMTRENVRQVEAKALRKLRHPSRADRLRDFCV